MNQIASEAAKRVACAPLLVDRRRDHHDGDRPSAQGVPAGHRLRRVAIAGDRGGADAPAAVRQRQPRVGRGRRPGGSPRVSAGVRRSRSTTVAGTVAGDAQADLRLQFDPWLGRTTSDPELRPDFADRGEVRRHPDRALRRRSSRRRSGHPARRCSPSTSPAASRSATSSGCNALEGVLPARPAGIGGQLGRLVPGTADTSVCVVLWSSRSLVLGLESGRPAERR